MNYNFILNLDVIDSQALYEAAAAHPDGLSTCALMDIDGNVDIEACLITLLDPSTLPGCEIHDSVVS